MAEQHEWFTVFRTDENDGWLYSELVSGRLRQGWGAPGLALVKPDGQRVGKVDWEAAHKRHENWGNPSPMRFAILSRMLEVGPLDIVVVPKMPEWNQFTIASVSEEYRFELSTGPKDFGHVIPVDPDSVRTFDYRADNDAFLVSGLFARANHRPAVSFCYSEEHLAAARNLLKRASSLTQQPHSVLAGAAADHAFKVAAEALAEQLRGWNGLRFEEAVRQAFRDQGYEIEYHRHHDGQGGDADIVVAPPASYGLFLPGKIAVQVKWKQGIDPNDEAAVRQIVDWAESQSSAAAKYVISSASDFTEGARKLADKCDVTLICGLQTMCFLLGVPDRYRPDWT